MVRKRECQADGGVMYCRSSRCPERIAFFGELEVADRAKGASVVIARVQKQMQAEGFKAQTIMGIDDLLPNLKLARDVWNKKDLTRLERMLIDENGVEKHLDGEAQDVSIAAIQSTRQSMVKLSALHHYLKYDDHKSNFASGVFNKQSLPVIVRNGDQLTVVDGTHRFVTSCLMGEKTMRAIIVDLV